MKRVLDYCSIQKIDDEAWLDIVLPGMLFRLKMTAAELRDLLDVGEIVHAQIIENVQPNRPA